MRLFAILLLFAADRAVISQAELRRGLSIGEFRFDADAARATVVFKNVTGYALEEVRIECSASAAGGGKLGTGILQLGAVSRGETRKSEVGVPLKDGAVDSITCGLKASGAR